MIPRFAPYAASPVPGMFEAIILNKNVSKAAFLLTELLLNAVFSAQ